MILGRYCGDTLIIYIYKEVGNVVWGNKEMHC